MLQVKPDRRQPGRSFPEQRIRKIRQGCFCIQTSLQQRMGGRLQQGRHVR
jgi:hypothetical protein